MPNDLPSGAIGEITAVSGRDRLTLTADHGLVSVHRGAVNVFVELVAENGASIGPRRLVAALEEGAMLPLPGRDLDGLRLMAVGVGAAELWVCAPGERVDLPAQAGGIAAAIEIGLTALLRGMRAQSASENARMLIAHGETVSVAGGVTVSAGRPSWVEIRGSGDRAAVSVDLIGPGRAVTVPGDAELRSRSMEDLIRADGWRSIDQWMADAMRDVATDLEDRTQERRHRVARRLEEDADELRQALGRLPDIDHDGDTVSQKVMARRMEPPIVKALRTVCDAEGIRFVPPPDPTPADPPSLMLQDVLRRANLRFRAVALSGDWWRREGESAVGFDVETGEPVAILRTGPGRFDRVSSTDGSRSRIGPGAAAQIDRQAYVLFRPLPYRPLGAMDLLRHVLTGRARPDMRWAAFLAVLTAALGLLPPILTGVLLNEVVPFAEEARLVHLALGLAFVALGSAAFQLVRSIALLRVEVFADGGLQAAVWDRLLRLPMTFFRRYEIGDLLIKAMGPTRLRQAVSDTALGSALSALFSLVNFGLMLTYSAALAGAALGYTLASGLILLGLSRLQLRHERDQIKADAAVSSFILQILAGIQKVRLTGAENRAFARWMHRFADARRYSVRAEHIGNATKTVSAVLPVLASILFFYMVGATEEDRLSVGSFVAFNAAFGGFHSAMLALFMAVSTSLSAVPVYENMKPVLDAQPELDPSRKSAPVLDGGIRLSNVSFRYAKDGPLILDGLQVTIEPGQFVAFVGPSGSGKSTIFRLLLGFEAPEQGTVGFDGLDLSRLDLGTVRRQIGVVLQRGTVLPGSIYENIVGSAPLSMDEAWKAARMAGFDEDIQHMPMGMHTVLTEGGGTLSGGQRQRLMIARAIVRRPRILLMDEATSALDNRTQAVVAESLSHLDATRVVIAHRLSTVIDADRIFVIDQGRVVQSGSYDQLRQVEGPFRRLARRQIA